MCEVQQPRHIAIYIPSLRGGGAERVMVTLANAFAARGHRVDLVLVSAEGPYLKDLAANVRVVDLKAKRVATSLPGLVSYLRKNRPIALLAAMGHANVIAVAARGLARVTTRVVVSERRIFSASKGNNRSIRERMMEHFVNWSYPRADGIICISEGVADDLCTHTSIPRNKTEVVYNPLNIERVQHLASLQEDLPFPRTVGVPIILGVGRLVEQKDFGTLIRAFARLRAARPVRLCILGDGPLRNVLNTEVVKLGVAADVILPGFLNNPFVVMRYADLFVLSSVNEGFGNVLVEAMACGTPVVSTDCPSGPAEILEGGRWGRLVPVGDEVTLANAMAAALDETEHPDVLSRAAVFSMDRAVNGYLKVMLPERDAE